MGVFGIEALAYTSYFPFKILSDTSVYPTSTVFLSSEGLMMHRIEIEGQNKEQVFKDHISEFHLRSLDIDIASYVTKLKKLTKN